VVSLETGKKQKKPVSRSEKHGLGVLVPWLSYNSGITEG